MIDQLFRIATENIDRLFISYLYLEQKPQLDKRLGNGLPVIPNGTRQGALLPSTFFCRGSINGDFRLTPRYDRSGYRILEFAFPSHQLSAFPKNNTVRGRLFLQLGKTAPCVLFLHGWRMRTYLSLQHMLRFFLQAGYHAAFMELPFHYTRSPEGSFSGEKMIDPDIRKTLENIRQAVCDTRDTLAYLSRLPRISSVGLVGVSLGGWVSSLVCTAEKDLSAAVLISPPAHPVHMFYRSEVIKILKKGVKEDVDTYFEQHKKILSFCQASAFPPLLKRENIFIVEALHDRFVPKDIVEDLWRSWECPPIGRYPHGHISLMLDPQVRTDILTHLAASFAQPS